WFGGKTYVNVLTPGVTDKFLEVTMDAYTREIGEHFGKRVPGAFTDEPQLRPAGGMPWCDDLPELFEKRWGYSLTDRLVSLGQPVGEWKRVRHNYFQLVLELFIERWAKPYYDYCAKHGLEFTGHYWEHEWPRAYSVPDSMAASAWQQRPGIDMLMNKYAEGPRDQFGNVRAAKELSSVANQLGRARTLCEAYGAAGWDLRFEDMKRLGDWLYVFGINMLDEHLSFITIRGARKRDHPQSFSYHEPWWDDYHVLASYFTRLSAVLSQGQEVNKVLVLEPTTTTWMYQPDRSPSGYLMEIGNRFQKFVVDLAKAQVEYDIGSEDIIARHGSVQGNVLKVGQRQYETVVIHPLTENLNTKTMELLEAYAKNGGKVLCCAEPPALIDGQLSDRGKAASQNTGWRSIEPAEAARLLAAESQDGFAISRSRGQGGILYHYRRKLDDGEILFLANASIDSAVAGLIKSPMRGIQKWDPETGDISPYMFVGGAEGIKAQFELAPCGSLLLFLSRESLKAAPPDLAKTVKIRPTGPMQIRRVQPNVLTLDYVDVTVGGESKKNIYFYQASKLVWQEHGFESDPWDRAVQFRDELISKKFPADSGFEAAYRFTIEQKVPSPLYIVIERSDLYSISCNGTEVSADNGSWWLDKAFGKIDITSAAKVGENVVSIKASPMTMYHELESAYVLGDFSLKAGDSGFVISPAVGLKLGPWNAQGCSLYAAGVSYTQVFNIAEPKAKYVVSLPDWYGSVARVSVNDKRAGHIYYRPWERDVTELITAGDNTIEVTVIGTLRNTLGPHHGNHELGSTWPSMFTKAPETGPSPGSKYQTIGYGLFKPFGLGNR
ncbi:MAG: glycosyl hydrolase, partial [Planctomycetota bacterium]